MRLYKIKTHFYGKDLDEEAILGYAVAENDDGIYDHINKRYKCDKWSESVEVTRKAIIAANRNFDSGYTKYGWEDLGEVSADDIANLKRLKVLPE